MLRFMSLVMDIFAELRERPTSFPCSSGSAEEIKDPHATCCMSVTCWI